MNRRPGLLRRAVAVAAAAFAVAGSLTWSSPTAVAATPQLTVEITGVAVSGSKPSDQVTVTGRVSNPAGAQVSGLVMAIWRSRDPIGDLPSLRQVTGPAAPPGVILSHWTEGSYLTITAAGVPFAPGAIAEFTIHASLADLGFDTIGRAYLVGARALGTATGSTAIGKVGQGSTVLSIPDQPVPVTRLVMLAATPTKLADDLFRNDDLQAELTGRLDVLLTAAAEPGMSWLIDPALYDEVADMADGYQIQGKAGPEPGTGQQVAASWLTRFKQLDQKAGARGLFGDPDLAGATAASDAAVATRARSAANQVAALRALPLVVWPTGGVYSDAVDAYLGGDAPLIATNSLVGGVLQTASSGRRVLASATTLPADPAEFAAIQFGLAETLVSGAAGQLRVLRSPADLAADRATTADWQSPRLLGELLAGSDAKPGNFETTVVPETLAKRQFKAVDGLEQAVTAYRRLAPDSSIPDEADAMLSRAVSQAWIGQDKAHEAVLDAMDELIGPQALKKAVRLDAAQRFVMSARTSQFPLTVTNNLTEPIRVKVRVETDNPQRLRIPDSEVVTIPPGQSVSLTIHPEATANGVAIARAWVATEDGRKLSFSPDAEITIEMTELGFVGWVIVIASGAVVLGATAFRIWQVRRKTKQGAEDHADAPLEPSELEDTHTTIPEVAQSASRDACRRPGFLLGESEQAHSPLSSSPSEGSEDPHG